MSVPLKMGHEGGRADFLLNHGVLVFTVVRFTSYLKENDR